MALDRKSSRYNDKTAIGTLQPSFLSLEPLAQLLECGLALQRHLPIHSIFSQSIFGERITKQQAWLPTLLHFPFPEVDHVHVSTEAHRYGSAVTTAYASIVSRIRTIAGVI